MAAYDVSRHRQSLLDDTATLRLLPAELLRAVQVEPEPVQVELTESTEPTASRTTPRLTSTSFLDAIAHAALLPRLTGPLFAHFEPLFADICARWLLHAPRGTQDDAVLAAFARVLPLAPCLSVLLDKYLAETAGTAGDITLHTLASLYDPPFVQTAQTDAQTADLLRILVVLWRLVGLDADAYAPLVPAGLQTLFSHHSAPVRYVAIRIFARVHAAADQTLERLLRQHVADDDDLVADLDGADADYAFLTLYEHARCRDLAARVAALAAQPTLSIQAFTLPLTPLVTAWGRTVIPRPALDGPANFSTGFSSGLAAPSVLVPTATTLANLEALGACLQRPAPVLLRGLPGCGKTSLVREAARELGMDAGLVTLHLNEQTDAKTLIGLYATDAKPGSFKWRPGILTAAVQAGRWVLIEDLDRAPNEVMSTILPLIERRELLIPSRRETVKAPRNFRIFATVRTALGLHGQETTRPLLGERLWQPLAVRALPPSELREVVDGRFPTLHALVPDILAVFEQLTVPTTATTPKKTVPVLERPMTLRDLMKWCRRLARVLVHKETLSDTALLGLFLDAVDCFAGSCKDERVRTHIGLQIAQALRIPPDVAEHALAAHEPVLVDGDRVLTVGRATLRKPRRAPKSRTIANRPFATTAHARRLLEQIAVAVELQEPLLLVGETGIGKTTVVQQLAETLGHRLVVVNLSQQSEVGDLLGGFKPVNARTLATPLKEEFEDLFGATGISADKNERYLKRLGTGIARGRWADVCKLWQQAPKMFDAIVAQLEAQSTVSEAEEQPTKRRKTTSKLRALLDLRPRWAQFSDKLAQFSAQVASGSGAFAFAFVEGKIVQAVRNGDWLLLDEINLASPDTLESIADLLASGAGDTPSILLSETGELDKIAAHPSFRVFGAMNPATDVGKRDLPIGLRSRFTELYVASPDRAVHDLAPIIKTYLRHQAKLTDRLVERVARLYLAIKGLAEAKRLVDGANEVPHYSLRTLTRVLRYVDDAAATYGLERALYEGFCMGFLTLLSQASEDLVLPLIIEHLLDGRQTVLSQTPRTPGDGYVRFVSTSTESTERTPRQYWLLAGAEPPLERDDYIRTAYVERNLLNLVRATSTRRFPILVQGPTSAGKTSMIEYLAQFSGNRFVRINNHEHTDLQEYLGTYVSGDDGRLRFQEGVLVQAMRQGHWIVLDELNLAPTDVLEALNRLLDDNRELLIPETQEVVRPHARFMLFATQNPAGLYGGRKVLSRAFRNRFLELHFDDIPEHELGYILQQRCRHTAPSDCERIVAVYKALSRLRQTSRVFEDKQSFATLRDLFRWGLRQADTREQLAAHGFMLLAERVRDEDERQAVKGVIEQVFKVSLDLNVLYSPETKGDVIWTKAMRRLVVLVMEALKNDEPVLLVGETGCGKTTVVQHVAAAAGRALHIVNAHQNTETGDLIGSQRPVRNRSALVAHVHREVVAALDEVGVDSSGSLDDLVGRLRALSADDMARLPAGLATRIERDVARSRALFAWSDGSLVHAMKAGSFFLLDEISLADDSVLERLNSVLEPQRTLLLAEKAEKADGQGDATVTATPGFQFLATMNPGGDFGKKELSPALRNRFTEIWVPALTDAEDVQAIVAATLDEHVRSLAPVIVAFSQWFGRAFRASSATPYSIRDILVWAQFVNRSVQANQSHEFALVHGAATVFVDTLGANPSAMVSASAAEAGVQRAQCLEKLGDLLGIGTDAVKALYGATPTVCVSDGMLWAGDFFIPRRTTTDSIDADFDFDAPTTRTNVMRVVRALQMDGKPVLLEGNPGVGKTALVGALARACGQPLTRINLSDQTDLMDLFGTDVPVEGADAGHFAWRDAPFLQAMQRGEWVLLDEMNLASQTVLEGLNACLDHRGQVYIAELDQTFQRHPDFRLFAAQNPHHQGGGRKGLPSSFVNRFLVVYADVLAEADQLRIAHARYPAVDRDTVRRITAFVAALERDTQGRVFGLNGSPWEFNLRDTLRWLSLLKSDADAGAFLDVTVRQRFRTSRDRAEVARLFADAFGRPPPPHSLYRATGARTARVGVASVARRATGQPTPDVPGMRPAARLPELESLLVAVTHNLPCILVGGGGSGKSALVQHAAALTGAPLVVFSLSADVDAMDLVGGFEQADPVRDVLDGVASLRTGLAEFLLSDNDTPAGLAAAALLRCIRLRPASDKAYFERVLTSIGTLAPLIDSDSALASLLASAHALLQQPLSLAHPRFEWLDSVIVRAAQAGHWLVLDNANLCSASVLDRLNSLLERPHGLLSINEHCAPDGTPRIVPLHPDFRVFLTVDPRYGELSRAMRNRAVEIFVGDNCTTNYDDYKHHVAPVEARMERFLAVVEADGLDTAWVDNLALGDTKLLARFVRAIEGGRLAPADALPPLRARLALVTSPDAQPVRDAIVQQYASLSASTPVDEQPMHPLQNTPLVQTLASVPWWRGAAYERFSDAVAALEDLRREAQHAAAYVSKLSLLTRLQRSALAGQVAAVQRDSTVHVHRHLTDIAQGVVQLCRVLASLETKTDGRTERHCLHTVWHFWMATRARTAQPDFDEAQFQAHLGHGRRLLTRGQHLLALPDGAIHEFVATVARRVEDDFAAGFRLTTGLSIDTLWPVLRPLPIPDADTLRHIAAMERLAARFDSLKWRLPAASVADLGKVTTSLAEAYRLLRTGSATAADADDLVTALAQEIVRLEVLVGADRAPAPPLFAHIFEAVRQLHVLHGPKTDTDTLVLSDTPTTAHLRLCSADDVAGTLQTVDYLMGQADAIRPWSGTLASALLRTTDHAASASTLASLRALETELPLAGRVTVRAAAAVVADPVAKLNETLWTLLGAVLAAHDTGLQATVEQLMADARAHPMLPFVRVARTGLVVPDADGTDALTAVWPDLDGQYGHLDQHLVDVLRAHLLPAVLALTASSCVESLARQSLASVAWVQLALGCVRLYTPDKVFDPYLKWQTEHDFDASLRASLVAKADALRAFDRATLGQAASAATNARLALVEADLAMLDAETDAETDTPPIAIYRPASTGPASELSRLQKDVFNPVLDVTVKDNLGAAHYRLVEELTRSTRSTLSSDCVAARQELQMVQGNIERLVERLLASATAYQDLAVPLANLLRCLQLGLSLSETARDTSTTSTTTEWLRATPFLDGRRAPLQTIPAPLTQTWEFLQFGGVCAAVDGSATTDARRRVHESFHYFFEEWKRKVVADARAEEERNNLYRFRGSFEDEEELDAAEFSELFPTYDESAPTTTTKTTTTDLSADVAAIHRAIVAPERAATDLILDFCTANARKMARLVADDVAATDPAMDARLLPAALLVLDAQRRALQDDVTATTDLRALRKKGAASAYNFYADANLPEARKLVALVHDVQARFQGLQRVDEIGHLQPLADVLGACDVVLAIGFREPLARVLPRVEKLHEYLYEWQFRGHAPRHFLAPTLYDRTTATIVAWRKLELATWSRLFDTEAETCRRDAAAWWFVAYEAAVAGPLSILQESNIANVSDRPLAYHAEQLAKELAAYLASSMAGQYAARLDLLRQILAHLDLVVADYPAMHVVRHAVHALVDYYARFAPRAMAAIKTGRDALQKKMNDVLLLASWRDTNMDALRESARRSHLKLFRLVRKFRAVLGQPMAPVIAQGLPEEAEEAQHGPLVLDTPTIDVRQPTAAAALCAQLVHGWGVDADTRRLAAPDRLVGLMAKAAALPAAALDVPDIVAAFLADLLSTSAELRSETPSVLNDETKATVKHLKTRKTRLYDDTVKAVRQMGFSSNLGRSRVAAQASLELVVSTYRAVRLPGTLDLPGLEYALHRCLDVAPSVRNALYDHHSDLQSTVARRSAGYFEGILYVALQQRDLLANAADTLAALDRRVAHVERLSDDYAGAPATHDASSSSSTDHARAAKWLAAIVRVAAHLVGVHARLGDCPYRAVQDQLDAWAARIDTHVAALNVGDAVPAGFVAPATVLARRAFEADLGALHAEVDQHTAQQPELAYILAQIKLWAVVGVVGGTDSDAAFADTASLDALTEHVLSLSRQVLNAVQKRQQSVADLPTSTEDSAWLVDHSTKLSAAVKALHMGTVVAGIDACIDVLRALYASGAGDSVGDKAAPAMLRVLLPLLQQYATTARHTLLQLAAVHRATCQLGYRLGASFAEIAARGFCTPAEKSEDASADTSGKLEDGTGLGDGQGAEDISKDIQPDEDLSELAQTANEDRGEDGKDDVEEEKDAIDMGTDEMEGDMGSVAGDEEEDDDDDDDKNGDDDDDMDEEAGDVDDLDPTAVDEKMWDGEDDAKDTDKEQQGNDAAGQKNEDQSAAADENASKPEAAAEQAAGDEGEEKKEEDKKDGDDDDDGGEMGSDDEEAGPQQDLNRQDQNVDQNDVLDLPDDMQIDDEEGQSDDGFDNLEDLEGEGEEEGEEEEARKDEALKDEEMKEGEADEEEGLEATKEDGDEGDEADVEADGEGAKEEAPEEADEMEVDDDENEKEEEKDEKEKDEKDPALDTKSNDKPAPNDVQSGVGQEQDNTVGAEEEQADAAQNNRNNDAQRDAGEMGQADADEQETTGGDGQVSRRERAAAEQESTAEQAEGEPNEGEPNEDERQPFKKLGDVLERWHKTRQEIQQAEAPDLEQGAPDKETSDEAADQAAQQEFQHLHDDEAVPTTQAMGAAEDEEARPFDDRMAVEEESNAPREADPSQHAGNEEGAEEEEDAAMHDEDKDDDDADQDAVQKTDRDDGRTGASMQKGAYERDGEDEEDEDMDDAAVEREEDDEEDDDDDVASQLLQTHLDDAADADDTDEALMTLDEATQQWSAFQTATHGLSLALSAQLRLILTPSQATRLSGGFRTGKRLSIRKIIPYIASGYKRDKIWMRRAVPTKRTYQILLCVDDSKSMGAHGHGQTTKEKTPGHLALSSLVMVGRALSMLEAGQVGVLGFGARVFAAHALDADQSFGAGAAAGGAAAQTLRRFTFQQDRTDVALLLRTTIDRFTQARAAATGSGSDLWQLALILSDGLTPSAAHERIRQLLREAAEARIMVVFVILDGARDRGDRGDQGDRGKGKSSDSVLDLKEAKFVKDATGTSRVVIERYLDTFPFPYYLIVHHLDDLPSALSGLLRTWFAEVNA